jgi:hypothetical protein
VAIVWGLLAVATIPLEAVERDTAPPSNEPFAEWLRQSESKARQFQRCYFTADPSRSRNGSKAAERCGFHADHSAARIIGAKSERSTEVRAGTYFEQAGFYHHRQVHLQPLLAKSGTWDYKTGTWDYKSGTWD